MTSPINASALLDNTAVTENLLDFATNLNSPSTPAPTIVEMAPTNPPRSRPLLRYTRLQTVSNQARRNRQGSPRTRVTNNTYMTNTGRVYRKNHIALKRNVNKCEILAKRSAAAPVRGVRTGQMPPGKTAPIGQTTTPTQRCPITIVSASHQRRSTAPPVVLLSDSDSQEAVSRTQSPKRSPRAMSTHQPATRI